MHVIKQKAEPYALRGLVPLITLFCLLIVAGCGGHADQVEHSLQAVVGQEDTAIPSRTPTSDGLEGTEGADTLRSPLPTAESYIPWDAQPAQGKANLRGRLEASPGILLGELFLAQAVPASNPDVALLELDQDNSPRAFLDRATGRFVFVDIEPGKYGLIVWEPMNSVIVNDPETGGTLFVTLSADRVVDVGTLPVP